MNHKYISITFPLSNIKHTITHYLVCEPTLSQENGLKSSLYGNVTVCTMYIVQSTHSHTSHKRNPSHLIQSNKTVKKKMCVQCTQSQNEAIIMSNSFPTFLIKIIFFPLYLQKWLSSSYNGI